MITVIHPKSNSLRFECVEGRPDSMLNHIKLCSNNPTVGPFTTINNSLPTCVASRSDFF